ncbi:MAG: class II fumarate hydratase [Anaerolineales bacterium]|nr:class II fumarate hydratase [Anaerolineales bacterium]MBS3752573.1 class II fumarate hydratase [Anaerolineales bacterium]
MRREEDTLGAVEIPTDALWGAQTQRAIENFPISGLRFGRTFLHSLGHVKQAAVQANLELGKLDETHAQAIQSACQEIIRGKWDNQFPLDVFQTGSGTSTNMNANEVIANRANQILGGELGSYDPIHPNDHVNMSQSSNDVIPSTIHVAGVLALKEKLIPALEKLQSALADKAEEFDDIVKSGRTHLQDAAPIRLGQEFSGYASQAEKGGERARKAVEMLLELPLGGTAVGTGLNSPPAFPEKAIGHLNQALQEGFREAENHFEANAARDALVNASGQLKVIAVSLTKIANDIRWLGSGPRSGLGELSLPEVQPGSSIMPGKNNPVLAESLIQVAAQVISNDYTMTLAGLGSYFELNTMLPLFAYHFISSVNWLANAVEVFVDGLVLNIEVNHERCLRDVRRNLSLVTALVPYIGHERAAKLSRDAHRRGQTIREAAEELDEFSPEELDVILDPKRMTESGKDT